MTERIETEHLILRKARDSDLDPIWRRVWMDARLAETMLWTPTLTRQDAIHRLERTKAYQAENHAFFVCLKETDEPIGFGGIREAAPGDYEETGICIAGEFQSRGYGKEVLRALVELAFYKLNGRRFLYGCFHENETSAALCKSLGFIYTGSEELIRERDGYCYLCDHYELQGPASRGRREEI